jgi:neutral ceramidase
MMLETGCGSAVITPKAGLQLAGFLGERKAIRVHDNLLAKAVYLADGPDNQIMLIIVDMLEVDRRFVDEVRIRVQKETGVPASHCLVAAIHTHSGPTGLTRESLPGMKGETQVFGEFNAKLFSQTVAGCVMAARKARRWARKGSISTGVARMVQPVCGSRRTLNAQENIQMRVIRAETSTRCAVLYNLDCHPTVLHEDNLLYSADFPGYVATLMPLLEPDVTMPVFLNGAAGDMSTRFYRKNSGFDEAKRIGGIVAESVVSSFPGLQLLQGPFHARAAEVPLRLALKKFPSPGELEQRAVEAKRKLETARSEGIQNLRPFQSELEGLTFAGRLVRKVGKATHIDTCLTLLRFGDILIAGIPGEMFSNLGNAIRNAFPDNIVLVAGYCGDYVGYMLDEAACRESGYEALSTFLAIGEGERIRDEAIKGLRALMNG